LLASACNVATPPRIASSTGLGPIESPVRIAPVDAASPEGTSPEGSSSAARQQLLAALQAELADRGVAVSDDGALAITVALSTRPAAMGVSAGSDPGPTHWLSVPRKPRFLDACRAQRLEAVIVAKAETRPQPAYTGRGGFDFCTLDPADLASLGRQFAADMVSPRP